MSGPIMPAWATDTDIETAVDDLVLEITGYRARIDHLVTTGGPVLVDETDAMLAHISEGW